MSTTHAIHEDHQHQHGPDCGHASVTHGDHSDHQHGPGCGHEAIQHGDHVDYLHDGHRHALHDGHWDEH